jgi:tRNA(Ile)-lysidine synthase
VALLHVLHALGSELHFDLRVAHFDHEIRGAESREDARFVAELAESLDLSLVSGSAGEQWTDRRRDVSLEEAARRLRYEFLEETARDSSANRIATGHTMDDQAETVLMRIIQGTGPGGLSAIRPVRDSRVIRPLIRCRSEEIAAYLRELGATARADSTNQDPSYLRNRVRMRLLPLLKEEFNPNIEETLARLSSVEREVDGFLQRTALDALDRVASRSPGKIRLALERFGGYHVGLRLYMLRMAIGEVLGRLEDISFEHIRALTRLASGDETPFKHVTLPGSLIAYRERGALVLTTESLDEEMGREELAVPGTTRIPRVGLEIRASLIGPSEVEWTRGASPDVAHFDWDVLEPPLQVRGWQPGDRFRPAGMRGRKKIQDFFVDEKIPRSARSRTPLLVDRQAIHWVIGYRTSEPSRVSDRTKTVLQLEAVPLTA